MDVPKGLRKYFAGDLGFFYAQAANRLMLYPFIFSFFLVECSTFWLLYQGPAFFLDYMAFITVYSLHKAAVYSTCIFGADVLAHRLAPSWGAYNKRSVQRQWVIWSLGLAAGFVLQRTMVRSLIVFYAPDVVAYFTSHPQERLSAITLLMILIPYWVAVLFVTILIAMSRQRTQQQTDSLLVIPGEKTALKSSLINKYGTAPMGSLELGDDNGNGTIALGNVTHITVEDHYCRINYATESGLKNKMTRLPLKEMLLKLPPEHFLKIHRSHVVNRVHISHLARKGRDYKAVLQRFHVELPISRSRFKDLFNT